MNMILYSVFAALALTECFSFIYATSRTNSLNKFYRNDYTYNLDAKGWLKYHKIPATWHETRLRCKYEGATLASPLNDGILNSMKDIVGNGSFVEERVMFIGIHATFSKGDFVSVEGIPVSDIPFFLRSYLNCYDLVRDIKSIPDCLKDCMILMIGGAFFTADCNLMLPYMCYKEDLNVNVPMSICGHNSFGYKYDERTDSCYKVHTIGRTWPRAFMTCLGEGAHLAIINSELESQVLRELLAKYPANKMLADHTHVASIGVLDWGERGSWWTIHGETLEEAGYTIWENGKPDSQDSCVGMNRSGKLNDIHCNDHTFPLICEKKVTTHNNNS